MIAILIIIIIIMLILIVMMVIITMIMMMIMIIIIIMMITIMIIVCTADAVRPVPVRVATPTSTWRCQRGCKDGRGSSFRRPSRSPLSSLQAPRLGDRVFRGKLSVQYREMHGFAGRETQPPSGALGAANQQPTS